jgi:UPF0755 protein
MSENHPRRGSSGGPLRRVVRLLLALLGLIGVFVIPVWIWSNFAPPPEAEAQAGGVAGSVSLPQLSGVEDTLIGVYLRWQGVDAQAPVSDDPTPVSFSIVAGETAAQVAERLEAAGLIGSAEVFRALLRVQGADTLLEAGEYTLRRNMSMPDIMATLQDGRPTTVTITIPEGWRVGQIAEQLEAQGLVDAKDFLALADPDQAPDGTPTETAPDWEATYDFLAGRPDDVISLEGYLFPDTYEFAFDVAASDVVDRMLTTFDTRFTVSMREQAAQQGFSVHEIVTLASIVEREARVPDERRLISGVFHNRIEAGMHLNADPTVQYALGYQAEAGQWWKRPLFTNDLGYDSLYNTYVNVGLPPGPICNPGLAALEAAVSPANTEFYYFVANDVAGDGSHVFAETLQEHSANIDQYRR